MIINRYRSVTIAYDYFGDSILNSVSDIGFMMLGFLVARRLPVAATIAFAIILELFTLAMIRDNLTLNVLMLVWPIEAIRHRSAEHTSELQSLMRNSYAVFCLKTKNSRHHHTT